MPGPVDLARFRALAKNWRALGDVDPMFGVLSDPAKYGGRWAIDEFYETGRAHVTKLRRILAEHDVTFDRGDCLDFGCGMGRLTIPLAAHFSRTVGVDVARSMIGDARRHVPADVDCRFVVNSHPDLREFPSGAFDVVHTCLVLQHIPPDVSVQYIAEFFRVARPGGLVVFQLPAETRTEAQISALHALPDDGYRAEIMVSDAPGRLAAGERTTINLRVVNRSAATWRHDIPAGRHICIANHWRHADGSTAVADDGRAYLPVTLHPGESADVALVVQAPAIEGEYELEIDLVQERVCWFAERGSPTARVAIRVQPSSPPKTIEGNALAPDRSSLWQRLRRWYRGGTPTFEMCVVPRESVEATILANGGRLLHAIDDNAAGERWLSYTYVCRKT